MTTAPVEPGSDPTFAPDEDNPIDPVAPGFEPAPDPAEPEPTES